MKTCRYLVLLAVIGVVAATAAAIEKKKCEADDYNCGDKCIPGKFVCDGVFDCGNGMDEDKCEGKVEATFADDVMGMDAPTFNLEFLR